jgi:hypothetical protein
LGEGAYGGYTYLDWATDYAENDADCVAITQFFIDAGIDVNHRSNSGTSALYWLYYTRSWKNLDNLRECEQLLLDNGAVSLGAF